MANSKKSPAKSTTKADAKTGKKTAEPVKEKSASSKPSKKGSKLAEIGDSVYSFATQGNSKKAWEIEQYAKDLGADAKVVAHETALHLVQVELSLGKEKITIPSEGYLTITMN